MFKFGFQVPRLSPMVTSVGSTAVSLTETVPTRWTANGCATAPLIVNWPSKVSLTGVAGVLVSSGTGRALLLQAAAQKTAASAAADRIIRAMCLDLTRQGREPPANRVGPWRSGRVRVE